MEKKSKFPKFQTSCAPLIHENPSKRAKISLITCEYNRNRKVYDPNVFPIGLPYHINHNS